MRIFWRMSVKQRPFLSLLLPPTLMRVLIAAGQVLFPGEYELRGPTLPSEQRHRVQPVHLIQLPSQRR
jgi:hypothetical protein